MNRKLRTNISISRQARIAVTELVTCHQRFLAIWYGCVIGERDGLWETKLAHNPIGWKLPVEV